MDLRIRVKDIVIFVSRIMNTYECKLLCPVYIPSTLCWTLLPFGRNAPQVRLLALGVRWKCWRYPRLQRTTVGLLCLNLGSFPWWLFQANKRSRCQDPKLRELVQNMVSRVFKREIRHWCNHKVDQFVAKKYTRRNQPIGKVQEGSLYIDSIDGQYEIFWWKFPEDLYNWLRELKRRSQLGGSAKVRHNWTPFDIALLQ